MSELVTLASYAKLRTISRCSIVREKEKKRKMRKRGQMQVQFNWLYVAIVGAIILALFVNIASGIRNDAKNKLAVDAVNYFDEIFTSVQASENTENSIILPGLDLEIATEKDFCSEYSISGASKGSRSTEFIPLFSPHIIKTRILTYSLGWDIPFRVNYFLFLTSPEIVYVSVGSNSIKNELPEHLSMEEDDYNNFINQNYYKVRFFSTSSNPSNAYLSDSSVTKLKDEDVTAIYINEGVKSVTFYQKEDTGFVEMGTSYYIDDTTLIAAIYSENFETYDCNMQKALKRLNKFSDILKARIGLIKTSDLLPLCSISSYETAENLLTELKEASSSYEITSETINKINSIKTELHNLNTDINKKSCPTVY